MDTAAHRYANEAEEQEERGRWTEAIELHFLAADQFLLATKDTQNQEVIRTLKLMNANHNRQGKDLQRRVAKATAAAAAADAAAQALALAQAAQTAASASSSSKQHQKSSSGSRNRGDGIASPGSVDSPASVTLSSRRRGASGHQEQGNSGGLGQRRHHLPSQHSLGVLGSGHSRLSSENVGGESGTGGGDAGGSGGSYLGTSSEASSSSSSAMIEESFTLIKNHVKDDSDPFNKFWEAVENLVLKISSPVAFTSIPLDGDDPINTGSILLASSPTSEEPPLTSPVDAQSTGGLGGGALSQPESMRSSSNLHPGYRLQQQQQQHLQSRHPRVRADPLPMQESFFIIDSPSLANSQSRMLSRNRSASASASESLSVGGGGIGGKQPTSSSLRRSETAPRSTKTLEEYAIENQQLKVTLDKLSRRNLKLEKHLEGVMQMSVWTKDVQRSAMQLIKSQDILRPVKHSIQDQSPEKSGTLTPRISAGPGALPPTSTAAPTTTLTGPASTTPTTSFDNMSPTTMQVRLKELTEELQQLKIENAKQNALMKKYKQRWEDLKESAKKRRNATPTPPPNADEDGGPSADGSLFSTQPIPYRQLGGQGRLPSANPYSASALVGSSGNGGSGSTRPLSNLARSSSASGPVMHAGGSYQRRIIMESKAGGLDHIPLNMNRQSSSGIVSSTSPRVLDAMSRTTSSVVTAVPPSVSGQPTVMSTLGFLPAVLETRQERDSLSLSSLSGVISPRSTPNTTNGGTSHSGVGSGIDGESQSRPRDGEGDGDNNTNNDTISESGSSTFSSNRTSSSSSASSPSPLSTLANR
ncbi:hypothetical protein BGZ83_006242 [Gryganskiella cystojenkinii]|nr:hypothetical protein BGZ83_006242 [Gryganskiella cystojenkinii]